MNETNAENGQKLSDLEKLALVRCAFRADWGGVWREVTDEEQIKNTLFIIEEAQAYSEGIFGEEASGRAERVARELINAYRSAKAKIEGRETPAPYQTKSEVEAEKRSRETPSQTRARHLAELEQSVRETRELFARLGKPSPI